MNESYWNEKMDFLKAIRTGWFNDDYIEFLIDKVWKINKPVNIIDFGCGFGYVGLLFMPILPAGSTYTGIDISAALLDNARSIFANSGYAASFIKADLNEYMPDGHYDIAISQAVLRHIPNAGNILKKMIQSVAANGLVICMETDLELEKAGQYFSGLDYFELGLVPLKRKMWKKELKDGGRDHRFAMKIPMLMQELGLHNVDVRMNDRVKFINPNGNKEEHRRQFGAITTARGWDKQLTESERVEYITSLFNKGLNRQEAEMYVSGESKLSGYVMGNKDNAYIIQTPCTLISYGRK
jgi:2-polyprenyl-3-methyl-5-hydroxy-6-metoxy-1,4-benzoquinol methylase